MHGKYERPEYDESGNLIRVIEIIEDDSGRPVESVLADRAGPLSTPARGEAFAMEQHRQRSAEGVKRSRAKVR